MIVLVMRLNYKCYWEGGFLVHVFIMAGTQLRIGERLDD